MITLASYPRSGNTFLRNVLFEVYGVSSGTFLLDGHGPDADWDRFEVVKTHHLPGELPKKLRDRPSVYLLRDGRDSLVSFAHHRKDIVAPGSDYRQNLTEAIYAAEGSHFGGWSRHAEEWSVQADVIIRFEDLIIDPIGQCERLRTLLDLPEPKLDCLPDFESLKNGTPEYGAGKDLLESTEEQLALANKWFRRGKVGAWKEELPADMHDLFWHLHGETMEVAGYPMSDKSNGFPLLGSRFLANSSATEVSVAMEATKVLDPFVDGIKRYVVELLRTYQRYQPQGFDLEAFVAKERISIEAALEKEGHGHGPINAGLLGVVKQLVKWLLPEQLYNRIAKAFPLQLVLARLRRIGGSVHASPAAQAKKPSNVLHLTLPQNHLFHADFQGKVVATVHDLTHESHPEFHEQNNIHLAAEGMGWIKEKKASLIAVSESTQNDLTSIGLASSKVHLGVDRRQFYPIPNKHLLQLVRDRYGLPDKPFILSLSTLEPRKNLRATIQAYTKLSAAERDKCHLVLAGRKGWKWSEVEVPKECWSQIHFTGFVRDDHLPALYTLARAFCYMSHYEGFGLPVLEAMACRTPAIASNVSSLPEVIGDTGLLCAPTDISGIADSMSSIINNDELCEHLSDASMKRSWIFTWSRTAEQTLAAYQGQHS